MADITQLLLDELKKQTRQGEQSLVLFKTINQAAGQLAGLPAAGGIPASLAASVTASPADRSLSGAKTQAIPAQSQGASPPESGQGGGSALAGLASAFGGITAAVGRVSQALQAAVGQVMKFTEALAPAIVQKFQFALRDLNATIGVALQPLAQVAASVARSLGQTLLPIMEQLKPIVEKLGGVILTIVNNQLAIFAQAFDALLPVIQAVADVFAAVLPFLQAFYGALSSLGVAVLQVVTTLFKFNPLVQILTGLLSVLTPYFQALQIQFLGLGAAVSAIAEGLTKWLGGLFGIDVSSPFKFLKGVMETFGKVMILATANVLKFLSATAGDAYIGGVIKALEGGKKKDNTGLAAATNPSIGNIESITSETMKAALLAGGGPTPEDEQKKWREDLLGELKTLKEGGQTILGKWWDTIEAKLKTLLVAAIREAARAPFNAAASSIADSVKSGGAVPGAVAGAAIGGLPGAVAGAVGGYIFGGRK